MKVIKEPEYSFDFADGCPNRANRPCPSRKK